MTPSTTERVPARTADKINRRIEREMIQRLYYYQQHPGEIDQRLDELDQEWGIERALEMNASALISSSVLMSLVTRKPSLLAAVVSLFLLQQALQGWCPPLPLLRRLGFRTRTEIDTERYALKMLRGDLDSMQASTEPETAVEVLQNSRGPGHHLH